MNNCKLLHTLILFMIDELTFLELLSEEASQEHFHLNLALVHNVFVTLNYFNAIVSRLAHLCSIMSALATEVCLTLFFKTQIFPGMDTEVI